MIQPETTELGLIVIVAVLIATLARNRGWNASLLLLATGLIFGTVPIGPDAPTDPEFVLVVVLAPLVFGEALSSSIVDLKRVSRPVMALAVGLVVFGAFVVGFVASRIIPGIPVSVALCLGAILGPTDAVAVAATAKAAALPRRLVHILEGESLVNDGTALTLLRVFAAAAVAGAVTAEEAAAVFVQSVLGGLLVGAVAGFLLILIIRRSSDTTVSNGCVLIAPFPIYAGAEQLDGSGILAVVVAALILAHATSSAVTYTGRLKLTTVWRTVIFVLQAVAFFIVGLEVPAELRMLSDDQRLQLIVIVPAIVVALILSRVVFVFGMAIVSGTRKLYPRSWIVMAWAGTRGPISALAAFTLPLTMLNGEPFPERSLLISVTFCVVLVSLLLSPTIGPLARALKLPRDDDSETIHRVRVALAKASLDRLEEMAYASERADDPLPTDVVKRLRGGAERRLDTMVRTKQGERHAAAADTRLVRKLTREMARAEQQELLRLRDEEGLPDELMRELQKELDIRVRALAVPK